MRMVQVSQVAAPRGASSRSDAAASIWAGGLAKKSRSDRRRAVIALTKLQVVDDEAVAA
jgi:hypothetical protein